MAKYALELENTQAADDLADLTILAAIPSAKHPCVCLCLTRDHRITAIGTQQDGNEHEAQAMHVIRSLKSVAHLTIDKFAASGTNEAKG
jgi:hypothetical protein